MISQALMYAPKDPWNITAVATFVLAAATAFLASFTWWLARSTKQVVEQNKLLIEMEDRHHADNLRPYCVLEIIDLNRYNWGSTLFSAEHVWTGAHGPYVMLNCRIVNKGLGPALDVCVGIKTVDESKHVGFMLSILAAGDKFSINQPEYEVPEMIPFFVDLPPPFEKNLQPGVGLYIEYKDMFGKLWRSDHSEKIRGIVLITFPGSG